MRPAPEYRLPANLRLGPVRLQVADLSRSLSFYQQMLGLQLQSTSTGKASLGAEGTSDPLVELRERPGARAVPKRGRLGLFHFAILLPDRASLGRVYVHLRNAGVPLGHADHLVSEALYLYDRDGLGIELYADRPRETWRTEGNQLAMATDPLDLDSLVRASAGTEWRAMPSGTVMGHVHLHVGDLKTASEFYHRAIGFDITVWTYPGALFMSAGGYHHHLGTNTWAVGAEAAQEDEAQLLEWNIVLPTATDVAAVASSLSNAGHRVTDDGGAAVAADPWDIRVKIASS